MSTVWLQPMSYVINPSPYPCFLSIPTLSKIIWRQRWQQKPVTLIDSLTVKESLIRLAKRLSPISYTGILSRRSLVITSTERMNSVSNRKYTHTCPRKVSSRWATSESSVTREKLKFSATGRVSARQEVHQIWKKQQMKISKWILNKRW